MYNYEVFLLLIIDRIKAISKEKGIKISYLCSKVGQGRGYLNDINSGKCSLPDERLKVFSNVLGVSVEYLKGETDEKNSPYNEAAKSDIRVYSDKDFSRVPEFNLISEDGKQLIRDFASLPPEKRQEVLRYVRFLLDSPSEK